MGEIFLLFDFICDCNIVSSFFLSLVLCKWRFTNNVNIFHDLKFKSLTVIYPHNIEEDYHPFFGLLERRCELHSPSRTLTIFLAGALVTELLLEDPLRQVSSALCTLVLSAWDCLYHRILSGVGCNGTAEWSCLMV